MNAQILVLGIKNILNFLITDAYIYLVVNIKIGFS